jgi:hypothetical protein
VNGSLNAALAVERLSDLQRSAGCCTAMPAHRRAASPKFRWRLRFSLRGRAVDTLVCCA